MSPQDTEQRASDDRPPDEPTRRLAGSGDAVTVVGGSTAPGRGRRRDESATERGGSDNGEGTHAQPAPTPGGAKDRGPLLLGALAAVGFVLAAVFAGLYFTKGSSSSASTGGSAAGALRSAANQFASALFTFDANTLNQNISQAQALSTPAYAQTIASFYTADQVAAAKTAQASSRADIKSVYVESVTGDSASVFVVLTDTYANNKDPKPRVDQVRMILSFQRVKGAWKVADVQVLQAPPAAQPPTSDTATPTPSSAPASSPAGG